MKPQELQGLYESYLEIYEQIVPDPFNRRPIGTPRVNPGSMKDYQNLIQTGDHRRIRNTIKDINYGQQVKNQSPKPTTQIAHFDLFDVIKGHLLDEGYADTEEAALAIMANMSEDWRESIIEDTINERVKYSDNDYRGGGGDTQRTRTGMTPSEVAQLGSRNIHRAIEKEPLGTQIKQKLFGRVVPVPPNAGFKPGGWRMLPGTAP